MLTLIGILIFLLSFSAHELGHAFAMRRNGVAIKEMSLLGFGPKILSFKWKRFFGDTPLFIKLIPLGAYVEPVDSDQLKYLSYRTSAEIFGAGVLAQFLFCGIFLMVGAVFKGNWSHPAMIGITVSLACLGIFQKQTCLLVLPIGILFALCLEYFIFGHSSAGTNDGGSVVYVVQEIHSHATSLGQVIVISSVISMSVALTNTLPLFPLDGGRIFLSLFKSKRWSERKNALVGGFIKFITAIPFMLLIFYSLKGDAVRIFSLF